MEYMFVIATLSYPRWETTSEPETHYYLIPLQVNPQSQSVLQQIRLAKSFYESKAPEIVEKLTTGDESWRPFQVTLPLNINNGYIREVREIVYEITS